MSALQAQPLTSTPSHDSTPLKPSFISLPSPFFHTLSQMLISDKDLKSLSCLNMTCTAVREETTAALWGKVVFGGKYDWAGRFGLEGVGRGLGEGKGFVRMKKYVRHIVLTDTVSIPSHLRNKTWKILSTFPNLEKLEYKATYGSHAQDLYLFPHKSIVFPKLEKLSMNLLDVDDHQEYHIQPDPIDDPQTLFLNHGLIKHYVAALGGPGSLEARKSIGMSIWYQSMNTEFPIPEIGRSFPVLVDFHIRCGAHNGIDISKQVGQTPRKSSETVKVVRFEAVRGGQETAEILAFGLFPRCEHLHIRMMHHQITSTAVDLTMINMFQNLKTFTLSLSHCGWQEKYLAFAVARSTRMLNSISDYTGATAEEILEREKHQLVIEDLESWVKSYRQRNSGFKNLTVFHRDDYRGQKNCAGGKWFKVEVKSRGKNKPSKVKGKVFFTDRQGQFIEEPMVAPEQGDEGYDKGHRQAEF